MNERLVIIVYSVGNEIYFFESVYLNFSNFLSFQQGMRSVILKIGGMSVGAKKKHGFYGAKFTNIKLKFVPPFEVISSFLLFSEYSVLE